MPTKARKAAGARLCRVLAFAWASFAPQAFAFDSPFRSVAWHQLDSLARVAAVIGCVVIPAVMLCALAAGGRRERRLGLAMVGVLALLWGSYARLAGTMWFVGSVASCANNGDGTQPTCAASSNGPGRERGWNNLDWASYAAGDTICFVGDDTENIRLNIQKSGDTAANGQYIKLTGDCNGQTRRPVLSTTGTSNVIDGLDDSGIWLDYLDIVSGAPTNTQLIRFEASSANQSHIKITRLRVQNHLSTSATPNHGIYFKGANGFTHSDVILLDNETFGSGIANTQNSDGVNIESVTSGLLIDGLDTHDNYYNGLDVSGAGTNPVIRRVHAYRNGMGGIKLHCGNLATSGGQVVSNLSWGNGQWGLEFDDWPNTLVAHNTFVTPNAPPAIKADSEIFGGMATESANPGTCTQTGNVIANNVFSADYQAGAFRVYSGTRSAFESGNTFNGNVLHQRGTQSVLIYFAADLANNVTSGASFATWKASHPLDLNADPQFIGGPNPTTAEGFRPSATSPLVGAGTDVGSVQDFFGDTYYSSPDIGAFRRDSCYRRSRDGKLDMARTRAQVASRCLGIPGRYPEGL